jgi:indolepyruvate ferredoxin oxidoreductase beta subunit
MAAAPKDYALAVELVATRRLVKGYSDTHARGQSKFDKVMLGADKLEGRADAAEWVARLREAALKDEDGIALSGALKTIDSFV